MSSSRPSERLRLKIELASGPRTAAARELWNHPRVAELYPHLLLRNHWIIRTSVPLMEAAHERAKTMTDDPVAPPLAEYLGHHIKEERHHDEWLLDDLEVLGMSRGEVLGRVPSATVAALAGAQYYWIHHHHPVALLGYIAVLEGSPPSVEFLDGIIAKTGLPRRAFRTFLKHAQLDPHHRDDLDRAIDALPLEPEHASVIGVSAFQTVRLLGQSLAELLETAEREDAMEAVPVTK